MIRRAVITSVGVVSAFGVGAEVFFNGLAAGRGAVGEIRSFDARTFPSCVAGEVPLVTCGANELMHAGFPEESAARWERDGLLRDRKVGFGLLAALEAWRAAGCGADERDAALSIALGLERAFLDDLSAVCDPSARAPFDWSRGEALSPTRFRSRADACASLLEAFFALGGPVTVHVSACAAGGLVVAQAASLIERGVASMVLCGASDSMVNPLGIGGMARLNALSPRSAPDACRPFDRRRDGLVIGEGAAMFVVEDEARARARGARPLAYVLGSGSTQDAWRATAPRPDGASARAAMTQCLRRAGLAADAVDYINAHGTGTPLNDPAEARAIRGALGAHTDRVAVSSIKGAVGHLMAASGAIELAACLLPVVKGVVPGTANHRERDPECELDVIGEAPRDATNVNVMLSNSFGFGGQNVTVALARSLP